MTTKDLLHDVEEKMKKTYEVVAHEFALMRTGRASGAIVEGIKVDCYGTTMPLKQLAGISTPEPRLIVIQPWDASIIGDIERALLKSDLGITPNNDGKLIRLSVPPLTKERREELVRLAHKLAEDGRISMRTVRRDANERTKALEDKGEIAEDERFKTQDQIQKLLDKYIKETDTFLARKEKELMEV